MLEGDLVVVTQQYRGAATFSIANAGGQSWTTLAERNASSVCSAIVHWARYNGTWAATPQFGVASGTLALTTLMQVFRPTISAASWVEDVAQDEQDFAAGTTPFTKTLTGRSVSGNTITVAIWYSVDDNTWGTLAGTGWSKTGLGAQYRNITGSDQSLTAAYYATVTAAAVPNVSQNQATLGGDFGTGGLSTWQQQVASQAYTITGAITGAAAIAAVLDYTRNASITGAITGAASVSAALDYTRNASILGAITGSAAVAATLAYNRNFLIAGAITGVATVAAAMQYTAAGAVYEIAGAITGAATVAATLAYNRNAAIAGAITGTAAVAAAMAYNQNPVIVGTI